MRRSNLTLGYQLVLLTAGLLSTIFFSTQTQMSQKTISVTKKPRSVRHVVLVDDDADGTKAAGADGTVTKASEAAARLSLNASHSTGQTESSTNDNAHHAPHNETNQIKADGTDTAKQAQTTIESSTTTTATDSTAVGDSPSRLSPPPPPTPSHYFITAKFGRNNRFAEQVSNFAHFVNASGIFASDHIFPYSEFPDFILSDARFAQHTEFLRNESHPSAHGGGYWFWKSVLLQHHLKQAQDGDFVVYLDADQTNFVPTLPSIMRVMHERQANLAVRQLHLLQKHWTKPGVHDVYCPRMTRHDIETDLFFQVEAGRVVLRKSTSTVELIDAWVDMVSNYHMLSDEAVVLSSAVSNATNPTTPFTIPGLQKHRHDQSLFSALLQCGPLDRRTIAHGLTEIDTCAELERDNVTLVDEKAVEDVCTWGPFVTFVIETASPQDAVA
jgi:hypothetical protein